MAKDILLEIGLEELPARFVDDAETQLKEKTASWFKEQRIAFNSINSYSTPRRLAVHITGVAEEQETIEEEAKGPAEKIAKDENGNWSKAAIGFTKGQGKDISDIYIKEIKGTNYIYVSKVIKGKPTYELLPAFQSIIESIQFGKNMRWGTQSLRYARPIRWITALFGSEVIPFEVASVVTSNVTYGHRFLGDKITLTNPEEYKGKLEESYVIVDSRAREKMILDEIESAEEENGYQIPVDKELLAEVRNLVEYPTLFIGSFEEQYLKLPSEVLITSMKEHQRYFPVKSTEGELLPHFVGVRNGDSNGLETVIKGNEKVLRARLSDAAFFYNEDKKHSIDFFQEKLGKVVFQEKLGTIGDKTKRIIGITGELAKQLESDEEITKQALRAAEICKFDLMTNMVNEFTKLQGIIGEKYAHHFGEKDQVASAIKEHYLPVQANGTLPDSQIGAMVSVADKLDTIVGCIAVGLTPTGSQDPYALRRQALGVMRILEARGWNITLEKMLTITLQLLKETGIQIKEETDVHNELHSFFTARASFILKEVGVEQDITQAVLHEEIGNVSYTISKAQALSAVRNDEAFKPVQEALVRLLNLAKEEKHGNVDTSLFETDSEKELYQHFQLVQEKYQDKKDRKEAKAALDILSTLSDSIHEFFEHNMVMADDENIRANRLALVEQIAKLIRDYADLANIEWKQHF
ncbi:glycine--tRNA ligase subunit beta [Oceanobacillus picturae]|uniref:glycine--tRNA ligase subunit beta n=1 Tax=Oceanobacillus picturae TaxID=171693 RepID=UPI000E686FA3|nr:glycine--tRNA ligase subunit beta [Oceanobacillus picturae]RIU93554.1 glycine--tRNA ligase subunit beta [Oceanobacillus picturae]